MAKKKTTKTSNEVQQAEPTNPPTAEATTPTTEVLAGVRKGDQLRIEDRDGTTRTFACDMAVTRVTKDKVYCGSAEFRKDTGQEIGANDTMYAIPVYIESATAGKGRKPKLAAEGAANAKKQRTPKQPAEAKTGMSALDAAAKVLGEAGEPMNCQDMIKAMAEKGYWTSPGGKTPHSTLYAAIAREIKVKGPDSRFAKADKGKFASKGG
jgi:hypothetical protein